MKRILIFSIVSLVLISGFLSMNSNKNLLSNTTLENAQYITKEDDNLNVYDLVHKLTHSIVDTDKDNIEIIAPTKVAREKAFSLVDSEIYMKGDIDIYEKVGFRVEKLYYGIIDDDVIELHNIVAKQSGDSDCNALELNYKTINEIINDNKFFDDIDRQNYSNRLKELSQ